MQGKPSHLHSLFTSVWPFISLVQRVNCCGELWTSCTVYEANIVINYTIKSPEMIAGQLDWLDARYLVAPATAHLWLNIYFSDHDRQLKHIYQYRSPSVYSLWMIFDPLLKHYSYAYPSIYFLLLTSYTR